MSERSRSRLQPHKLIRLWKKKRTEPPYKRFFCEFRYSVFGHSRKREFRSTALEIEASAVEKKLENRKQRFLALAFVGLRRFFLQGVKPSSGVGSQASEKKTSKKIRKKDEKH